MFGSRLAELVFELNDDALVAMAKFYIRDAIESSGEDRVVIRNIGVDVSEENMAIAIVFDHVGETYEGNVVLQRNVAFNIVMENIRRIA